jgi:TIGR03009 family protein
VAGQTPIRQPGERPSENAPVNNRPSNGAGAIIPCPWDPLTPAEQGSVDELMKAWEQHSSDIERYRCNFTRWEFDTVFGPKDPTKPKTVGEGRLLYAAPDKGLFEVTSLKVYVAPAKAGDKEEWKPRAPEEIGEYWVCDGKRIFAFDAKKKQLIESELPPQMQGKAIVDGPLPFLFGAKADKIKARYWLRLITPEGVSGEQWIEASPKYAADALNFKMVHVIIDEKDFLPKAIQSFDPSFNPNKNPKRSVYTFENRKT